jgi:hypothetical protein
MRKTVTIFFDYKAGRGDPETKRDPSESGRLFLVYPVLHLM